MLDIRSQIDGVFTGFHRGAVFQLVNGQVWQQRYAEYRYQYKYRPRVRIHQEGAHVFAEFDCMSSSLEVVRASLVEGGTIVSDFRGFAGGSRFEFLSGRVWAQAEYKYRYHYAYRPRALVVQGLHGTVLSIDGMNENVQVQRAQ